MDMKFQKLNWDRVAPYSVVLQSIEHLTHLCIVNKFQLILLLMAKGTPLRLFLNWSSFCYTGWIFSNKDFLCSKAKCVHEQIIRNCFWWTSMFDHRAL